MRILVVTAMFPPIRTGSSFYARDLALAFREAGHEIEVVTVRHPESDDRGLPFPVRRLPAYRRSVAGLFKHLSISSLHPANYRALLKMVRNSRPDLIFLVNHYLDIALVAAAVSRVSGVPLVCSVHTQLQATSRARQQALTFFDRLICGKLVFPSCSRIVAMDTEIARYIDDVHGSRFHERIVIAPYGVSASTAECPHDYQWHGQVVGIGAVIEQRNFLATVRVFRRLLDHFPGLRLKILGHVYHPAAVALAGELGIAERVEFVGELPHAEVLAETARSDVYLGLFSGRYTGIGTAGIESMLIGVPAVLNVPENLFGSCSLVDGENYVRADDADIDAVVRRTLPLLESRERRERIGRGGRRFVEEHLSWSSIVTRLQPTLEGLRPRPEAPTG